MKRKALGIAAIWAALVLMVFIYTDRSAYTWVYEGKDASAFVTTPEDAQAAEARAHAEMDEERERGVQNRKKGIWRDSEAYSKAPCYLPAREAEALNLMWGRYIAEIDYASETPFSLSVVAPGRQRFIVGGEQTMEAAQQGDTAVFSFELTDSTQGLRLAAALPEGASISRVSVRRADYGVFSPDLAAYAALAGCVLTALWLLRFDGGAQGRERRRDAFILVCAALAASIPSLWRGVYDGHDLFFHLNRIEGVASALRTGQFPVRIHASTILGYGFASSEFYPELFLYFPALLRNLGVSLSTCLRVLQLAVNLAVALSCYLSAHRLYGSRKIALGASVLYTLCVYRLVNLYVRATLGESFAMVFFPILILGLYETLVRDGRRWPLLALAMTGILMSHLLSALFAAGFCLLTALLCLRRLLREPKRMLACLLAALLTALCALWFIVPFIEYTRAGISTNVVLIPAEYSLTLGAYLIGFAGNMAHLPEALEDFAYTIGVIPGLAMMLGAAALALALYSGGLSREAETRRRDRLSLVLLVFSALALLASTDMFPWDRVTSLPSPFSTFFMQMQFPWRLVGIAAPMLAMAGAWGYLRDERHASAGFAVLVVVSVLLSSYTMQCFIQEGQAFTDGDYIDTRIEQYEYTYPGTLKSALEAGAILTDGEDVVITDYEKRGASLSFSFSAKNGCSYVDLPLLYYPGYRAELDGMKRSVRRNDDGMIRVYTSVGTQPSTLSVWYEEPTRWRVCEAASLAGFALLFVLLGIGRRRA